MAMSTSTTPLGARTHPPAAAARVSECPIVNAVTMRSSLVVLRRAPA